MEICQIILAVSLALRLASASATSVLTSPPPLQTALARVKRQSSARRSASSAAAAAAAMPAAGARVGSSRLLFSNLPLKPSLDIIPPDIMEIPNPLLDPRSEDLNVQKLLELMGPDFDREIMAVDQPLSDIVQYPNGHLEYSFRNSHTVPDEMPPRTRLFDSDDIKLGPDGPILHMRLSRRTRQKLQRIVWAFSYCPVRYKWKQLHQRFWPRWIRQGACDRSRSCSLPAGMQCQPKATREVKILRFHCPYGENGVRVCRWIKFGYPILSECSCGCDAAAAGSSRSP